MTDQGWLLSLNRGSNYRPFRPNVQRAIAMTCATVTEKGSSSSVTRLHHNLLIPAGLIRLNLVQSLLNFLSYLYSNNVLIIIEHGTRLQNGCNQCICHFGEIICTRYRCDNATGNIILSCPLQFNPVCSNSGKRFLNSCVSQWQGTSEVLEPCSNEFSPECYTVIQLVYSQKQVYKKNWFSLW